MQTLYRDELLEFIKRKHNLSEAKLEHIDTSTLGKILKIPVTYTRDESALY